jgi:hypothetical protein
VCNLDCEGVTSRNQVKRRTILFFHQARKGGCRRFGVGGDGGGRMISGFEQKFAYLLPDKIAHPGGGDIPCEQLDGMWPRPLSLLVGALTAGPTAEGGRPSAGLILNLSLQTGQRAVCAAAVLVERLSSRRPFDGFRQTLCQ